MPLAALLAARFAYPRKIGEMGTFSDSIRALDTQELTALLAARPDLASPSPANLVSLAARASNSASLARALATLNARRLQVLESVFILRSLGQPTAPANILFAILGADAAPLISDEIPAPSTASGPAVPTEPAVATDPADATEPAAPLDQAALLESDIAHLRAAALLWQDEDGALRLAPGLEDLFDTFPAGFGPLSRNECATEPLPATAPDGTQAIVRAVLWGPPVALVPQNLMSTHPRPSEPATNVSLRWLLHNSYLELLDATHVYLPRQTAFALRGHRTHKGISTPPLGQATPSLTAESIRSEAARAALEIVRLVTELISLWEREPAPSLRNGGLPVRELKRVSNELDLSSTDAILVCELALAARLIRAGGDAANDFAPTTAADDWLALTLEERWSVVVQGWLASQRTPWRVGQLDERAATINALHPELHDTRIPRLRANIVHLLQDHPFVPLTSELVIDELRWHAPRAGLDPDAVSGLLREAAFLGLTGAGALLPGAEESLSAALTAALPQPVGEIFVQGDLTGMVPGRPTAPLEALLEMASVVESRGGALTVRFTPDSISRAFDEGLGAAELIDELAMYSVTPLPQPLTYLIADVARKHGNVRVGAASSYIRVPDEASAQAILASAAFASVGIFEIAPTVLGAAAPITTVLQLLREAGLAPVVESPDGQVITADRQGTRARVLTRPMRSHHDVNVGVSSPFPGDKALTTEAFTRGHRSVGHSSSNISQLAAQLRAEEDANPGANRPTTQASASAHAAGSSKITTAAGSQHSSAHQSTPSQSDAQSAPQTPPQSEPTATPADEPSQAIMTLREAISEGNLVEVTMADSRGALTKRILRPLTLDSGRLRAADPERESELTIAIHRIAAVTLPGNGQ